MSVKFSGRRHLLPAMLLSLATASALAATPATLRVDFYHGGNDQTEFYSLDRIVREPLPWPGNPAQPIDHTLRGKYEFQVRAAEGDDELLYSRSFSSIFGEWETTGEARRLNRTFHESLRFPDPGKAVEVILRKRAADNRFAEVWRVAVDPADYLVHEENAAYADEVVAIEQNGDPAVKVDLLLVGDGFTQAERRTFLARARELTDELFAIAPFRERRRDFNVWALVPASRESGVSRPSTGLYRDTPFGASYDAFRSERYVLSFDNREMRRIMSSAPYDFVEILVNSDTYGGGGIYGLYSTAAAHSDWAPYLFVHEFGHHFAGLADEYYTSSVAYETPEAVTEPYEPNVTALLDTLALKWRHLVAADTPLPTPWPKDEFETHSLAYQERRAEMRRNDVPEAAMNELFRVNQDFVEALFSTAPHRDAIGAFEGANYQANGYYRSEMNCIMFTRTTDFCRVCSAAIEQVIDEYTRTAGSQPD